MGSSDSGSVLIWALENLLQGNIFTKQVEKETEMGYAKAVLAPWAPQCLCSSKGRGQRVSVSRRSGEPSQAKGKSLVSSNCLDD